MRLRRTCGLVAAGRSRSWSPPTVVCDKMSMPLSVAPEVQPPQACSRRRRRLSRRTGWVAGAAPAPHDKLRREN